MCTAVSKQDILLGPRLGGHSLDSTGSKWPRTVLRMHREAQNKVSVLAISHKLEAPWKEKKNPLLKNGFHQSSLGRSQVILFTSDGWERTQPTMGSAIFGSVGLGCRRKVAEHQLGSNVSSVLLRPLLHLSPLGSCLQSLPLLSSMIQIVTNTPIKPFPLQVVGVTEKLGQLLL